MSGLRTLLATSAALALCGTTALADTACRLHRVASAEATVRDGSPLLVAATVAGMPVQLVVSTGFRYSALTRRFAERAQLPIEDIHAPLYGLETFNVSDIVHLTSKVNDAFGATDGDFYERARVPLLRLGSARSENEMFVLTPEGGDGTDGKPVGAFGADYLSSYEVELDPSAGQLNLYDVEHCPGRVVYWSNVYSTVPLHIDPGTRRVTTSVELDGVPVDAEIDTGAAGTSMPLALAARSFDMSEDSAQLTPADVVLQADGRTLRRWTTEFHTLTLGGVIVHNPQVSVIAYRDGQDPPIGSHIKPGEPADLRIGMNVLKALHLVISYGEGMLYYTPTRSKPL